MRGRSGWWHWLGAPVAALACSSLACNRGEQPAAAPRAVTTVLTSCVPTAGAAEAVAAPTPSATTALLCKAPPSSVRALSVGPYRTCALLSDRTARCWGAAWARFTPEGSYPRIDRPQPMTDLDAVGQLALGDEHACALLVDGSVRCWGRNREGELGDGTTTDSERPTAVKGLPPVHEIVAGAHHTCALGGEGDVWCWGRNHVRQLGADGPSPLLARVAGLTDMRQLALGANHSCALGGDGVVRCWGVDGALFGFPPRVVRDEACVHSLGVGVVPHSCRRPPTSVSPPVSIAGAQGAVEIAAGGFASCARMRKGRVVCWGSNAAGALGDGTQTERVGAVPVRGLCPAIGLALGADAACVVCADRSVSCWGANPRSRHTVMPDDEEMYLLRPTPVPGLEAVKQVALADDHACALGNDGEVRCWGGNAFGAVGNGTSRFKRDPVAVAW